MSLLLDALKAAEGQAQWSGSAQPPPRVVEPQANAAEWPPVAVEGPTDEQILTLAEDVVAAPAQPQPAAARRLRHDPAAIAVPTRTAASGAPRSTGSKRWVRPVGLAALVLVTAVVLWMMFGPAAPMPALAPAMSAAPPAVAAPAVPPPDATAIADTMVAPTTQATVPAAADKPDDRFYPPEDSSADFEPARPASTSGTLRTPLVITGRPSPLTAAHAALRAGDLQRAESLYRETLVTERDQPDAHLGLALIDQSRGANAAALAEYRAVLALRPGDPQAWAGLADLTGDGELDGMESRLRTLLATRPDAALHFALGNIMARQARWSDAQESYFAAAAGAPQNADYAFNLAVSLDRLGKASAAIPHYARALALAGDMRALQFDANAARARMQQLQAAQP